MSENIYNVFDVYILKLLKILREMSVRAGACECVRVRAISIPTGVVVVVSWNIMAGTAAAELWLCLQLS